MLFPASWPPQRAVCNSVNREGRRENRRKWRVFILGLKSHGGGRWDGAGVPVRGSRTETPMVRGCPGGGPGAGGSWTRLCPWLCVAAVASRGMPARGDSGTWRGAALAAAHSDSNGAVEWGRRSKTFLGGKHPAPQPSLEREVESNYWGLKRGGEEGKKKAGRKKSKLKGEQKAVCAERRTCHQSYQL